MKLDTQNASPWSFSSSLTNLKEGARRAGQTAMDAGMTLGLDLVPSTVGATTTSFLFNWGNPVGLTSIMGANVTRYCLQNVYATVQNRALPYQKYGADRIAEKILNWTNGSLPENASLDQALERVERINNLSIKLFVASALTSGLTGFVASFAIAANYWGEGISENMGFYTTTTALALGALTGNVVGLAIREHYFPEPNLMAEAKSVVALTQENFEKEVLQSDIPVVVDAFATWCGPCKMMAPSIAELSEELAGQVKFAKVDVDQEQELAQRLNITAMPTLLFYKNGEVLEVRQGALMKEDLHSKINQNFSEVPAA